jgi:ketosteroid isomerase-like protein
MSVQIGVTNVERLEAAGRTPEEQRNVRTVRAVYESIARSDFSGMASRLAPNGTTWVVGFTPERLGKHASNPNFVAELFCNGMHFDIRQAVAEGNRVFVEWDDECITRGGKHYKNTGIGLFEFNDAGQITSYREYIDPENFFSVLE